MASFFDKEEAQQDLARRQNLPVVHGVYRHYKGGLYTVLAVGIDEATGKPMVCYRSNRHATVWSRTLEDFQAHVMVGDDRQPRFRHLPE
jgi:hypothetical protein